MGGEQFIVKTAREKNKTLIFVIDLINGFAKEGALKDQRINAIIPNVKDILKNIPNSDILFICDAHDKQDLEMKVYPFHCLKDSKESQIVDELQEFVQNNQSNIIYKNTTNGFWDIEPRRLRDYIEFIVLGSCTDICIMQFALSLRTWLNKVRQDNDVIVYQEGVQTFDTEDHNGDMYHNFALQIMKQAGIVIKKWEEK